MSRKSFFERTQFDGLQDEMSAVHSTSPDPDEVPLVRPEFAAECDLNTILSRAMPFEARPVSTDYVDYGDNLQDALDSVARSREAWIKLPRDVTQRYRNWLDFAQAALSGSYIPPKAPAASASADGALEVPPGGVGGGPPPVS